jgi:uncharacterized protein
MPATKAVAIAALLLAAGTGGVMVATGHLPGAETAARPAPAGQIAVTIASANGSHPFTVEQARTSAEQEKGLMYRTSIPADGGMLFYPYPPDKDGRHQPPQDAGFWMKNTPSALDIVFIRADGTIARIAENAVPFDESVVRSGEPVGAVLELKGGRTAELGIAAGDKVRWAH